MYMLMPVDPNPIERSNHSLWVFLFDFPRQQFGRVAVVICLKDQAILRNDESDDYVQQRLLSTATWRHFVALGTLGRVALRAWMPAKIIQVCT